MIKFSKIALYTTYFEYAVQKHKELFDEEMLRRVERLKTLRDQLLYQGVSAIGEEEAVHSVDQFANWDRGFTSKSRQLQDDLQVNTDQWTDQYNMLKRMIQYQLTNSEYDWRLFFKDLATGM